MGVLPTRMMPMGAWRKSAPPPYDAEVTYLETSMRPPYGANGKAAFVYAGLTWGDLGPRDFIVETWDDARFNWGIMTPGNVSSAWIGRSADIAMFGSYSSQVSGLPSSGKHHVVYDVIDGVWVDGTFLGASSSSWVAPSSSAKVPLFVTANNGGTLRDYWFMGSVGRIQIRRRANGKILRDFQPVRVGSGGYLYDKVSNALYGNASTAGTSFVFGSDKTT